MQRSSNIHPQSPVLYVALVVVILGLALVLRLSQLDYFLMVDENLWYERSTFFLHGLVSGNLGQTAQTGHPGVTTMWSGTIGLLLHYLQSAQPGESMLHFADRMTATPATLDILRWLRLPLAVLSALVVTLAFVLAWRLWGVGAALAGAALMAFEPLFLAHSRVLHHDSPAADFSLLAVLGWLLYLKEERRRYLILAGLGVALAMLSKVSSVFLLGFAGLTVLPGLWQGRRQLWTALKLAVARLLKLAAVTGLVIILAWPAVWAAPEATWNTVIGFITHESGPHANGTFFMGRPVLDAGPLYYPLSLAFALTPLTLAGLLVSLVGLGVAWGRARRRGMVETESTWQWTVWLWLYAALFIVYMSLISKKQERYVLPAVVTFDLLAGWGYYQISNLKSQISNSKPDQEVTRPPFTIHHPPSPVPRPPFPVSRLPSTIYRLPSTIYPLVLVLLAGQFAFAWSARPYYSTFYNPLLGGAKKAEQLLLIGRGEGLERAVHFIQTEGGDRLHQVASWYGTTVAVLFDEQVEVKDIGHPQYILGSDYVIFYINQLQRELPKGAITRYVQREPPIYSAQLAGIDYAYVYRGKAITHPIDPFNPQNQLVGKASLAGFDLAHQDTSRGDTDLSSSGGLAAGEQVSLRLFWLNDGIRPDEHFYVRLADTLEQDWGWGACVTDPAFGAPGDWQDGEIIESQCELVIYPGTPPGDYLLRVGLMDERGTVVGQVNLLEEEGRVSISRPVTYPDDEWVPVEHRLQSSLLDSLALIGYDGDLATHKPGEVISLILYWRALREVGDDYTVRLRLEGEGPGQSAQWEAAPVNGRYPTRNWQAGEVVRDPWQLKLPASLPTGSYELDLALIGQDGRESASLVLGELFVEGREHAFTLAQPPATAQRARLGEAIYLLGFDLEGGISGEELVPGQPLLVTLSWQAEATPDRNYTVFVQLLDQSNRLYAQHDGQPGDGVLITTTWAPGEYVRDQHRLALPPDLPAGEYRLIAGMYLPDSGERLPLLDQDGQVIGDHVVLDISLKVDGRR
ncbi:MAG: hypothetical protein Kow0063_36800 [Anaerolineae bacterium]